MMSDSRELVTQEPRMPVMLTAKELVARARIIDEVFRTVMKKDVHYGLIPGCGDKPALFKGGAEKLSATFGIACDIVVTDVSSSDETRYRVEARASSIASGAYLGSGVGECSTNEEKYRWRKAPTAQEYDATPEDRRREKWFGGAKPYMVRQVRTNPADVANTVLKMAAKRGRVDMILTVLGCSDMFTQDFDDDDVDRKEPVEPLKAPQAKADPTETGMPAGTTATATPQYATAAHRSLADELLAWSAGDFEVMSSKVLALTTFTKDGQTIVGKTEISALSELAAKAALGKLRKELDQPHA